MTIEVVNMKTCYPPFGSVEGDIQIDRTTKWGNPYPITDTITRKDVLFRYVFYLRNAIESGELNISELKTAKRLGCWCKPLPCHGDILIKAIEDLK